MSNATLTAAPATELGLVVDQLADVNAEIARLDAIAKELKATLVGSCETKIEGVFHKAVISYIGPSEKVDWKAVAEKLNPSRQLIAAHTKLSGGGVRVSLYDL